MPQRTLDRDFDEGLGTVYERFMLNRFFDKLIDAYSLRSVLEIPIYGMTGLTGINSVHFTQKGCSVTLVDPIRRHIEEAKELWRILDRECVFYHHGDLSNLPFESGSFDLVWNFAALWHVESPESLLREMVRVSSDLILIFVPNKMQLGYVLRKRLLERGFFDTVDESWVDLHRIHSILRSKGMQKIEEGIIDVPPWPDTCMPIGTLLAKMGMRVGHSGRSDKGRWNWDIMSYYLGKRSHLEDKVHRFSFLEHLKFLNVIKPFWGHHRYIICRKYG